MMDDNFGVQIYESDELYQAQHGSDSSKYFSEKKQNINDGNVPQRSKKVKKGKREKKSDRKTGKWSDEDKIKYAKFYLIEHIKYPFIGVSWDRWKPDKVFPRMAEYIGTKNKDQVKSFDERMKKYYFDGLKKDIIDYALEAVEEKGDEESKQLILEFHEKMQQTSKHMAMIEDQVKKCEASESLIDKLLSQAKEL